MWSVKKDQLRFLVKAQRTRILIKILFSNTSPYLNLPQPILAKEIARPQMLDGFQMKDSKEMLNIWDLKYNKHNKLLQEQRQQQPASLHLPSASCSIIIYTFVLMFLYCFILTSAENAFASKTATSDKLEESRNDTVHESGINNVNNMLISRGNRDVANVPADVPEYDYDDEDDEYQIIKNKSGKFYFTLL